MPSPLFNQTLPAAELLQKGLARQWAKTQGLKNASNAQRLSEQTLQALKAGLINHPLPPQSLWGLYSALPYEINLDVLWQTSQDSWLLKNGMRVALPRCLPKQIDKSHTVSNNTLAFAEISLEAPRANALEQHPAGFWQPHAHWLAAHPGHPGILLIPCLALDEQGYRLGHGGGYYDGYLAWRKAQSPQLPYPITIGVAPSVCWVKALPTQSWDIALDAGLSEQGLHWFKTEQRLT